MTFALLERVGAGSDLFDFVHVHVVPFLLHVYVADFTFALWVEHVFIVIVILLFLFTINLIIITVKFFVFVILVRFYLKATLIAVHIIFI